MGVRSRLAQLSKVFGNVEPPAMQAGEIAAQMTPASPFSPGEPIGPYDGFNRTPRSHDFVTGYNISARPRSHERVAFETLRGLIEAYDVAQICIWHRIDSIRSLDWSLVAAKGYGGDVTDAIQVGMAALKKPDRDRSFGTWLAAWLYDILAYDAGSLYRMRNRAGRAIGLRVVDGTSLAPLLDYWGNPPQEPAEAYVQYVQGLPWNWLTRSDLIYEPYRLRANSPYGTAPLESILLNANTDLRFQAYFLQRFTEGNIPAAFASAPETWTPGQIETFQEYWDAFMVGDQAVKSQIKWLPGGGKIEWSNEKDFSDRFSLFLMRKTSAAYHVVPSDLGFTETVNRSSGESQADVQHRIGDLPLIKYIQGILTGFLQDDLDLPIQFAFDLGEEQTDRQQQAQADDVYIKTGVVSASEIREMRFGLSEPAGQPVPRFIYTTRAGPIPLSALEAVAGPVDASTGAPEPGTPLSHDAFRAIEGVAPVPPLVSPPLAEQIYGPSAAADPQGVGDLPQPAVKEAAAPASAPTTGITSATGITGYDLVGHHDEDEEEAAELAKRELTAFRRFRQARRRDGKWRDFEFRAVDPEQARQLNEDGRLAVLAKATGGASPDPKAPDGSHWPAWDVDERLAAAYAPQIRQAVADVLNTGTAHRVAAAWLNAADAGRSAEAWLRQTEPGLTDQITSGLHAVLTPLWTAGYAIGATSAQAVLEGKTSVDWAQYSRVVKAEGDPPTSVVDPSLMVYDQQSLDDWLAHYGINTIQSISGTRMGELAGLLEQALADGESADTLAADIEALGASEVAAQTVAITEISRAVSQSALANYEQVGVTQLNWLTCGDERVCDRCLQNAAASPNPLGTPWPSGDDAPPTHPRDRCSVIPADVGGVTLPSVGDLKDLLFAD